jgi:predicted MFS family arabinose efflux permease
MGRDLRIIVAALFAIALGEGMFYFLVPLHLEGLGAAPQTIGTVAALFSLAQMASMIPAGLAVDRWGPWWLMTTGWLTALIVAAVMALAAQLWLFSLAYVAYGLTAWVLPPLTSYILSNRGGLTPQRALTTVFASYNAGMIISPAIGGLVAERYGMRAPFALALVFLLLSTLIICRTRPVGSPSTTPTAGYDGMLRDPRYLFFAGIIFLVAFSTRLGTPLAPNYLKARWAVPVSQIGLLGSASSVGSVVLALGLGGAPPRRALVVVTLGGLAFVAILLSTGQIGWLALAYFLQAGALLARQFADAISARVVSPSRHGLAYAINGTVCTAAGSAAAVLAGQLYAVRPGLPFQAGLLLIPLAAAVTYFGAPRGEPVADEAGPSHAAKAPIQPSQ